MVSLTSYHYLSIWLIDALWALIRLQVALQELYLILQLHDFDMHLVEGSHGHPIEGVARLDPQTVSLVSLVLARDGILAHLIRLELIFELVQSVSLLL